MKRVITTSKGLDSLGDDGLHHFVRECVRFRGSPNFPPKSATCWWVPLKLPLLEVCGKGRGGTPVCLSCVFTNAFLGVRLSRLRPTGCSMTHTFRLRLDLFFLESPLFNQNHKESSALEMISVFFQGSPINARSISPIGFLLCHPFSM